MESLLNPDVKLIYLKASSEEVFFKNIYTGSLLSMSEGEYELLTDFSKTQSVEKTLLNFREAYEIDTSFLETLIQRAKDTDMLLTDSYLQRKEESKNLPAHHSPRVMYIVGLLNAFLAKWHLRTALVFRGNIRFYKILTIDLTETWLEKAVVSPLGQRVAIGLFWLTFIASLVGIYTAPAEHMSVDYVYGIAPPSGLVVTLLLLVGLLISTLLHELGHYLLYRRYGGETSEMGLAMVLIFLPFIYVSTNSLYLWDDKKKKMLVTLAGIMVDLALASVNLWLFLVVAAPDSSFLLLFFLYFISFRIVFNLMPFIPATDGYFLLTDLISNHSLYHDAGLSFRKVWQGLVSRRLEKLTAKDYGYAAYLILSYVFITAYYCMMALVIVLPFMVRIF